jgi:hypothetical protein
MGSLFITGEDVRVVSVDNEYILVSAEIPFVTVSLMRIQIDYHNLLEIKPGAKVVNTDSDIWIDTKSTASLKIRMVVAPT